jgi:potassium/hydrogen antiporter
VQTDGFRPKNEMVEVDVPEDSAAAGRQIVDLGLPKEALVLLIARGEEFVVPRGGTVIEAGDTLLVLADKKSRAAVRAIVGSVHETVDGTAP